MCGAKQTKEGQQKVNKASASNVTCGLLTAEGGGGGGDGGGGGAQSDLRLIRGVRRNPQVPVSQQGSFIIGCVLLTLMRRLLFTHERLEPV